MPWLCDHTVTASPSHRATAQLGATEACAMNGRLNSAASRRVTRPAAARSRRCTTGCACAGAASRKPFRSRSSGSESRTVHRAARASRAAAATAARSVSAITARKFPLRTWAAVPGGWPRSGTSTSVASTAGGRTTRPNSMPGSTRSCRNRGRPVTLSGRSMRGTLRPATDHRAGGLAAAPGAAARPGRPGTDQ